MTTKTELISQLTGQYIQLNHDFIDALKAGKPADELSAITDKAKLVLEEIRRLKKQSGYSLDKD